MKNYRCLSFWKETSRYQSISFSFHIMVLYLISDRIKNFVNILVSGPIWTTVHLNNLNALGIPPQVGLLTIFNSEQNNSYRALIYKYIYSRTLHLKRYSSVTFPVILLKIFAKIFIIAWLNAQVNQLNFTIYI